MVVKFLLRLLHVFLKNLPLLSDVHTEGFFFSWMTFQRPSLHFTLVIVYINDSQLFNRLCIKITSTFLYLKVYKYLFIYS